MPACPHCGTDLSPRATACPTCGEPGPAAAPPPYAPPPYAPYPPAGGGTAPLLETISRTDGYAIASIVCAVANFVGFFFVGGVLGVIFGKMAERRIAENPGREGASLARAGIVVGWVGIAVGLLFLLLGIAAFGAFSTHVTRSITVR